MSEPGEDAAAPRWRTVVARVIGRVGGLPAVRTLVATLATYDQAGGGLVAGGLAYSALIALLPGLLLALSVFGLVVDDPAIREDLVGLVATAFPPLEELVRVALEQVSAGAVPTGIVAVIGLLWGSSRFYAALDYAFSRVFHNAPRRNEVVRTLRGLAVTGLFVALPLVALLVGAWPRGCWRHSGGASSACSSSSSCASDRRRVGRRFVGGTLLVYRFVPGLVRPGRPAAGGGGRDRARGVHRVRPAGPADVRHGRAVRHPGDRVRAARPGCRSGSTCCCWAPPRRTSGQPRPPGDGGPSPSPGRASLRPPSPGKAAAAAEPGAADSDGRSLHGWAGRRWRSRAAVPGGLGPPG
jgi:hypothetical protein